MTRFRKQLSRRGDALSSSTRVAPLLSFAGGTLHVTTADAIVARKSIDRSFPSRFEDPRANPEREIRVARDVPRFGAGPER